MRVIIADDAVVIRHGLARLLADEGVEVCAEAATAEGLLSLVHRHQPDVAILDIRMPPTYTVEGLVAAAQIRQRHPGVGVLVLSQYVEVSYALRLLNESPSAVGYLLKDRVVAVADLVDTLGRIAAGGTIIDAQLVAELTAGPGVLRTLTSREREVLALLAEGRTDRGIAQILYVTRKTVEAHVRNIFDKLDLPVAGTENRRIHAVLTYLRECSRLAAGSQPPHES
jgi:DNA-binding NarL/FixJ family response regulator